MDVLQILFFAGLAVFLGVRLYMALGKPTGRSPEEHAREERERAAAREAAAETPATPAPIRPESPAIGARAFSGPAAAGLSDIAGVDRSFDPDSFAQGARKAYELIISAFANGDRDTLRPLLSERVMRAYDDAISRREAAGQTMTTEIERIKRAEIAEASLKDNRARVKLAFSAELASETRAADGAVVDGDLAVLKTVDEFWSFERDVASDDPNWKLVGVKPA